jgi:O-antigen ligase
MPLHPHNAILQLWIELGLPGAILGAALAILAIRGILARAEDVLWRAAALGLIAASLLIAFLSYGLWQRWWMSTLWLSAALMVATARQRSDDQPEKP